MIDAKNFCAMLAALGFDVQKHGASSLWVKSFHKGDFELKVDMGREEIPVPPLSQGVQQQFVTEIEALEKTIAAAQAVIDAAPAKKQAILQRHLS